jgi:hypothetical protein
MQPTSGGRAGATQPKPLPGLQRARERLLRAQPPERRHCLVWVSTRGSDLPIERVGVPDAAAMRVRIGDPALLRDLLDFLRRAECVAEQASADTLDVFVPHAPSAGQARRELDLYLATWRARHPDVEADVLER